MNILTYIQIHAQRHHYFVKLPPEGWNKWPEKLEELLRLLGRVYVCVCLCESSFKPSFFVLLVLQINAAKIFQCVSKILKNTAAHKS